MRFKYLVLSTLALASLNSKAGTTLPYEGPDKISCNVKLPENHLKNIDGGYRTDEDCRTIYVLPPQDGNIAFSKVTNLDTYLCKNIRAWKNKVNKYKAEVSKGELTGKQIQVLADEARYADEAIKSIEDESRGGTVVGKVYTDWSELIRAYDEVNDIPVKPMPIVLGLFSTTVYEQNAMGQYTTDVMSGVRRSSFHGFGLGEKNETKQVPIPDFLSNLTAMPNSVNLVMNQAIGFTLDLNLGGACAFEETSSYTLAGTYTYFYPVQSKSIFNVAMNADKLKSDIVEAAQSLNGKISTEDLFNKSKESQSVVVTLNEGAFAGHGNADELKTEYIDDLTRLVLDQVLSVVSIKMESILRSSEDTKVEGRAETHCKRKWYGSKKCTTRYYTIVTKNINWEKVGQKISEIVGQANAQAQSYKTLYLMGTSAMLPIEKTN